MKALLYLCVVIALLLVVSNASFSQLAGYALQFDGVDDFVDLPESASLTTGITNQITMEAWIYSDTYHNASVLASGNQNDYAIATQLDGSLRVDLYGVDAASGGAFASKTLLTTNLWYHVAVTYDGAEETIYINGVLDTSRAASGTLGTSPQGEDVRIGSWSGGAPNYFRGLIDGVRIWNIQRTQLEIQQKMNDTLSGSESGLVGYWRFDEGSGTNAIDLSIHGNDGTLVNGPVWVQHSALTVSVGSLEAHTNDTVSVPVDITFDAGRSYGSAEVSFEGYQSQGLIFLGVDTMSSLIGDKGWLIQVNDTDTLLITASAGAQDITSSGVLFRLIFLVSGDPCNYVPITISDAQFNTGIDSVIANDGGVSIAPVPVFGDVDENVALQAFDASLILKYLVGSDTLLCQGLANANVSCDSTISAYDATLILQKVVGLIDTLPFCGTFEGSGVITMSDVTTELNNFIDVPLHLTEGSDIYAFEGMVTYNPSQLTFTEIVWSPLLSGFNIDVHASGEVIKFAGAGSIGDGQEGVFATLRFIKTCTNCEPIVYLKKMRWNEGTIMTDVASSSIFTGVDEYSEKVPNEYSLEQNYPNPFNPVTSISYALLSAGHVTLSVFNMVGQEVAVLVDEVQPAGYRTITFDASAFPSGVYTYKIISGVFTDVKKMLFIK